MMHLVIHAPKWLTVLMGPGIVFFFSFQRSDMFVFLLFCSLLLFTFILYYVIPFGHVIIAGYSHVGLIKRGSPTLLNGMKVRVPSNGHIMVLESDL